MTARADVEARAEALRRERVPFVSARVVLAEKPTSAKPGDEAVVLADGTMEGFVGGTCAESTVRAQGMTLLDSGESLLLRISPVEEAPQPGKLTVHNPCLSGGTLEIFLEPVVPAPLVTVVGDTPIARALLAFGGPLGYEVVGWVDPIAADTAAVVVATHGRDEEQALEAALAAGVPYVGLVASRKRGEAVIAALAAPPDQRARVRSPAGLDIGARTPEEVALSILAEIVEARPRPTGRSLSVGDGGEQAGAGRAGEVGGAGGAPLTAPDPVCGMTVATVESSLHLDHAGTRWWFCGSGCLRAFADDPASYAPS